MLFYFSNGKIDSKVGPNAAMLQYTCIYGLSPALKRWIINQQHWPDNIKEEKKETNNIFLTELRVKGLKVVVKKNSNHNN